MYASTQRVIIAVLIILGFVLSAPVVMSVERDSELPIPPTTVFPVNKEALSLRFSDCASSLFAGYVPQAVATGDFNCDGLLDIAVSNAFSDNVSILLQAPDGNFIHSGDWDCGRYPGAGNDLPRELAVFDFDNDGWNDIAVVNSGHPQLGTLSSLSILKGLPDGNFYLRGNYLTSNASTNIFSECIAIGDVNQDGLEDIVVGNMSASSVSILYGDGTGSFALASEISLEVGHRGPHAMAIADLNFDGKSELIGCNKEKIFVLKGLGNGNFTDPHFISLSGDSSNFQDLKVSDLNNDGYWDVAIADFSGRMIILWGLQPDGQRLAPDTVFASPYLFGATGLAIDDWNGDGVQNECAVCNLVADSVVIIKPSPPRIVRQFSTAREPRDIIFADLNNDSMPEIITANEGDESIPNNPDVTIISNTNEPKNSLEFTFCGKRRIDDVAGLKIRRVAGACFDDEDDKIWLVEPVSNELIVLNREGTHIIRRIPLAPLGIKYPSGVAVRRIGGFHSQVSWLRLKPPSLHKIIFVAEKYSNRIYALSEEGTLLHTLNVTPSTLPEGITGIALTSSNWSSLLVSVPSTQQLWELSQAGYRTGVIDLNFPADDFIVVDSTQRIFAVHRNLGKVFCFNTSGVHIPGEDIDLRSIDARLAEAKLSAVAFNPDDSTLLCFTEGNALAEIDPGSKTLVRLIPLSIGTHPGALSANAENESHEIYVLDRGDLPHILVFDQDMNFLRTLDIQAVKQPPFRIIPRGIAYCPANQSILIADSSRVRYAMVNASDGHILQFINDVPLLDPAMRGRIPEAVAIINKGAYYNIIFRLAGMTIIRRSDCSQYFILSHNNIDMPAADLASISADSMFQLRHKKKALQRWQFRPFARFDQQGFINDASHHSTQLTGIAYLPSTSILYVSTQPSCLNKYEVHLPSSASDFWSYYK
ncbi:VCBS repeat-containing protein, partial [Candidatus Sumerlaeota bacterium]|nr:VCBS repeat-containing protein [Candidatus Sumerlaeota bacterium]